MAAIDHEAETGDPRQRAALRNGFTFAMKTAKLQLRGAYSTPEFWEDAALGAVAAAEFDNHPDVIRWLTAHGVTK
jgi:hypothetical protein